MKVRLVRCTHVRGPMARPFGNANTRWTFREGLHVVVGSEGLEGHGEASPLPNYSPDSLSEAKAAIEAVFAVGGLEIDAAGDWAGQVEAVVTSMPASVPSARFAVEVAMLDLLARSRGVSLTNLLGARDAPVISAGVVEADQGKQALRRAQEIIASGAGTLKVKVNGRSRRDAVEAWLVELRRLVGPCARIRLDANRSLPVDELPWWMGLFARVGAEFVEEPADPELVEELCPTEVALALDETLHNADPEAAIGRWVAPGRYAVVVLKPTVIGGLRRCMRLASLARARGGRVVVSHALEGSVAYEACAALSRAVGDRELAAGLGPHPGLEAWNVARALSVFEAAGEHPRQDAVVCDDGVLSYEALAGRVREAVSKFGNAGIAEDSLVAVVARPGLPELEAILALAEMGIAWVPIHPRSTLSEREKLVARCGVGWIIDGRTITRIRGGDAGSADAGGRAPPGTLVLMPTSGTSGRPKVAILSSRAMVAAAEASASNLGWEDGDRWLLCMPLAHVGGLSVVTRCLAARRCVVLMANSRFDVETIMKTVQDKRVTILSVVPTMLLRMLDRLPAWDPPGHVRAVLVGGAATPTRLLRRAADRGWPVLTSYGLTEACSQVATQRYGTTQRGEAGSGAALAGWQVRIEQGQVLVRGPALMTGYLGEPDPFDGEGWFATGDAGWLDSEGNLHVSGRLTDVIVTGGENVHPAEVEEVLEECPGVQAACVFGVADDEWGEIVGAALVGSASEAEVRAYAAGRLAPYKRPRRIWLCSELTMTASGKVDRKGTAARLGVCARRG